MVVPPLWSPGVAEYTETSQNVDPAGLGQLTVLALGLHTVACQRNASQLSIMLKSLR